MYALNWLDVALILICITSNAFWLYTVLKNNSDSDFVISMLKEKWFSDIMRVDDFWTDWFETLEESGNDPEFFDNSNEDIVELHNLMIKNIVEEWDKIDSYITKDNI